MLLCRAPAAAAGFGDVEVAVESEPQGASTHGYAELWVRVANRSGTAAHAVRLTYPKSSYSMGVDYLRAVTRTVTVEPGKTARVAIAYPERLSVSGVGLGVAIDGSEQDDAVPLGSASRAFSSRSRGYSSGPSAPRALVLYSRGVDTRFPDWANQAKNQLRGGFGLPVLPGGRSAATLGTLDIEYVRSDQPAEAWSPNWLGYTRYDGIVATADDLRTMPAEVRAAVAQYVEAGGSLLVLGGTPPAPWKLDRVGKLMTGGTPGFGQCFVADRTELSETSHLLFVLDSWARTAAPWQREPTPGDANRAFPVVDDTGVPVKGLLTLMFVFALVIGPLNLFVLTRWNRKLWLFWTVPAVSLVTCLGVFAYMAVTEGWQGRARVEGFTVLDENTRRASSIGWNGFYTPLLPGGGLHFGPGTEVAFQNGEDRTSGYGYGRRRTGTSALTLDWTHDQHLASGWLTPRVPAHFAVRKGEARRERVTIVKGAGGQVEAVNGLGADLTELWYRDEARQLYRAADVPAGGRVALQPATDPSPPNSTRPTLRDVYAGDWANAATQARTFGPRLLAPRTYLGVMDAAPFLDDGLPGASVRRAKSVVYGILREGGDEG